MCQDLGAEVKQGEVAHELEVTILKLIGETREAVESVFAKGADRESALPPSLMAWHLDQGHEALDQKIGGLQSGLDMAVARLSQAASTSELPLGIINERLVLFQTYLESIPERVQVSESKEDT